MRALLLLGLCWIALPATASAQRSSTADDVRAILAAERLATGGRAWDRVGAIVLDGTRTEGGVPGKFHQVIDVTTGHNRMMQDMGTAKQYSGYDGVAWAAANGIVTSITLPTLVEDARSQAFVDRSGWRTASNATIRNRDTASVTIVFHPKGGSEVDVTFDNGTHLVTRIVVETDDGPQVSTISDWRPVGQVRYAFRREMVDNVGSSTVTQVEQALLAPRVDRSALARPRVRPHGHLTSGPPTVSFVLMGRSQSHMLVPATVSGVATNLIFDTGGANYFSPESARRFGLDVSGGINLSGVGESSATGGFATAKRMSIGRAELRDETVVVAPLPFPGAATATTPAIEGIAGFEFLAEFRTTIDYPERTMTFASFSEKAPTAGQAVPFYSDGHSLYIEADVEGYRGLFRLDTGDGGTITLFPAFAARNGLYQGGGDVATSGSGVGGGVKARAITVSRFTLAGTTFDSLPALLSVNKAGAFTSRALAGNLGGGVLRCFRVTFDYNAATITFEHRNRVAGCGRSK